MLAPNHLFAGRYRIIKHLANGGMGVIFEAEHVATEGRVALKVLWPHVLQATHAEKRFELEAKVSARVNSEHIVKVLDAGFEPETHIAYLVMELLVGSTLAAHVSRHGPLPQRLVATLMRQVARGLDAAHGYRTPSGALEPIVHRDLKPENLFLCTSCEGELSVKILDYGIAKVVKESAVVSQDLRGTPAYMAYEQLAGKPLAPQTDVWSLGLITYYALTGRAYFRAANTTAANMQALFAEILALPLARASARVLEDGVPVELPRAFDAWLFSCVARDPAQRFASAGEAIDALEHVLIGNAEQTRSATSREDATHRRTLAYASTSLLPGAVPPVREELQSAPAVASERGHTLRLLRLRPVALLSIAAVAALVAATWFVGPRASEDASSTARHALQPELSRGSRVFATPTSSAPMGIADADAGLERQATVGATLPVEVGRAHLPDAASPPVGLAASDRAQQAAAPVLRGPAKPDDMTPRAEIPELRDAREHADEPPETPAALPPASPPPPHDARETQSDTLETQSDAVEASRDARETQSDTEERDDAPPAPAPTPEQAPAASVPPPDDTPPEDAPAPEDAPPEPEGAPPEDAPAPGDQPAEDACHFDPYTGRCSKSPPSQPPLP